MKFLKDVALAGKRVLVRADLNVPLSEQSVISDDNRIKAFLPTLLYIIAQGGKPIVMSHLGDPSGKQDAALSLKPIGQRLRELLKGPDVVMMNDCIGPDIENASKNVEPGRVTLLENLRFHPGEKSNDPQLCERLARLGDLYVNDAFGTAHRKHASMVGVPKLFKEKCAGLLMQKEIEYYERSLVRPKQPLAFVIGGAKLSTKLPVLLNLAQKAHKVLVGGAMANTFLAAQGIQMGRSLYEPELFPKVLEIMATLARKESKLYLPVDFVVGPSPTAKGLGRPVPAQEMPADVMALDIGPATSLLYREALQNAETIVWNGPMGCFENEDYAKGTTDLIESISAAHGLKVVGGGDTDAAIHQMELAHKFNFISSGGGAFLALLEGKGLPAFEALE